MFEGCFDAFTSEWTTLTTLRVALLLLLKEKGSNVPLSDIRMQFMEQKAHRHIFISSIYSEGRQTKESMVQPYQRAAWKRRLFRNKFDRGLL